MSVLTQFFGGGGGSSTGLPVEVLIVDGGNGAGYYSNTSSPYVACTLNIAGQGGSAIFFSKDLIPGAVCPITVGTGGVAYCCCASCSYPLGSQFSCIKWPGLGQPSCFSSIGFCRPSTCTPFLVNNNPYLPVSVPGKILVINDYPFMPSESLNYLKDVKYGYFNCGLTPSTAAAVKGSWCIKYGNQDVVFCCPTCPNIPNAPIRAQIYNGGNFHMNCVTYGFTPTQSCYPTCLGLYSTTTCCCVAPTCVIADNISTIWNGYANDITGSLCVYGRPAGDGWNSCICICSIDYGIARIAFDEGNGTGKGGECGCNGCTGSVVVRYPTSFAAATATSPCPGGVVDCSPNTPGYRTYRFLCPGSITLP